MVIYQLDKDYLLSQSVIKAVHVDKIDCGAVAMINFSYLTVSYV